MDHVLAESGILDLLHGVTTAPGPEKIVDGILADLHGLKGLTDAGAIIEAPLVDIRAISDTVLGSQDLGKNPLADLFYDDGGADAVASLKAPKDTLSDLSSDLLKIGFVGQPIDMAEELGGLTHGHNVLNLL